MAAAPHGRVAIIGAGAIGGAVIDRLLATGFTENLVACESREDRRREIAQRHGVTAVAEAAAAAARSALVVVAVPPGAVTAILDEIREAVAPPAGTLVVSFAGAVPLAHVETRLAPGTPVIRVNPNSPSIVGEGWNPVAYGRHATGAARALADEFLRALGRAPEVPDHQMNLYTALTAVGPTYFLPVIDAMVAAGQEGGLSREAAVEAALATARATAEMVGRRAESPEQLKLLTGLRPLKDDAVRQLVREAIQAAVSRMEEVQASVLK
jgi:pyrroline-5-carboxylate reductase